MKRRLSTKAILFAVLVLVLCLVLVSCSRWLGWQALNAAIRSRFPDVSRIRTPELAAWLNAPGRRAPRLLDVRERDEYRVSHLAGARQVEPGSDPATLGLPKDQPIVTYCSVGYRSAAYAQKLRRAGFTDVRNLEGSIFEWANEDRPLVEDEHPAERVHPYNKTWGLLLKPSRRATVPEAKPDGGG